MNENRKELRFIELVETKFAFLALIDFKIVKRSLTRVRFESSTVFIEVRHGERDYEVFLEFGRLYINQERISFSYCLQKYYPSDWKLIPEEGVAWTHEKIENNLEILARLFQKHAQKIIAVDPEFFNKVTNSKAKKLGVFSSVSKLFFGDK